MVDWDVTEKVRTWTVKIKWLEMLQFFHDVSWNTGTEFVYVLATHEKERYVFVGARDFLRLRSRGRAVERKRICSCL